MLYFLDSVDDPAIPDGLHGTDGEELFTPMGSLKQSIYWNKLHADNALDDQKIKIWIRSLLSPLPGRFDPHW